MDAARLITHAETSRRHRRPAAMYLVPLIVLAGLLLTLGWGLTNDPKNIPSPLVGKPVPSFELPPVKGRTLGLSDTDLNGSVSLVNVFASWCTACELEHPLLMDLANAGAVPIHGPVSYTHLTLPTIYSV